MNTKENTILEGFVLVPYGGAYSENPFKNFMGKEPIKEVTIFKTVTDAEDQKNNMLFSQAKNMIIRKVKLVETF